MAEEAGEKNLQNITSKFAELEIGDVSSGTIQEEKTLVCPSEEELLTNFALALPEGAQSEGGVIFENKPSVVCHSDEEKYFALALPEEAQLEGDLIFDNLKEAVISMKSRKQGRVQEFSTKEEAILFSSTPFTEETTTKDSGSPSVTPQILVQLRKTIEKGDHESFLEKVLNNPRLLIGKSDNPSVLQEGTHSNALHIAAKCDKPFICQLVLDILQNKEVLEKLYPQESLKAIEKRKIQLLDLYLNTPEKCLGETPLHYASKFGSVGCVKVLIAHPLCNTDRKNIDHKTAEDIICERVKPAEKFEKTEEMVAAFKNIYYVTILRSDDLLSPPVITKPSMIRNIVFDNQGITDKEPSVAQDLFKMNLKMKAFAGPMPKEMAMFFYKALKYPSTSCYEEGDCKLLHQIRKCDGNKGIERVARHLAEDLNTDFMEYHAFLNLFTNFSKDEGLQVLDSFFERRSCNDSFHQILNYVSSMSEEAMKFFHVMPQAHINALGHSINVYLKNEERAIIDSLPEREQFNTPPSSPESESEFFSASDSFSESPFKCSCKDLFIEGTRLTRVDVDTYLSMLGKEVDAEKFPSVYYWKKIVEKKLSKYQDNLQKMKPLTPLASVRVPRVVLRPQMETQMPGSDSGFKKFRKLF